MADIVLRNPDDGLKEKFRLRAAANQRSMNAEVRDIVAAALTQARRGSSRAELKKLAGDIRALSAGRWQTPSEELLRYTLTMPDGSAANLFVRQPSRDGPHTYGNTFDEDANLVSAVTVRSGEDR